MRVRTLSALIQSHVMEVSLSCLAYFRPLKTLLSFTFTFTRPRILRDLIFRACMYLVMVDF